MTDGFGEDEEEVAAVQQGFEPVRADNHDNSEGSTAAIDYRKTQSGTI